LYTVGKILIPHFAEDAPKNIFNCFEGYLEDTECRYIAYRFDPYGRKIRKEI